MDVPSLDKTSKREMEKKRRLNKNVTIRNDDASDAPRMHNVILRFMDQRVHTKFIRNWQRLTDQQHYTHPHVCKPKQRRENLKLWSEIGSHGKKKQRNAKNEKKVPPLLWNNFYLLGHVGQAMPWVDLVGGGRPLACSSMDFKLKTVDTIGTVKDQSSHLVYLNICIK